MSLRILLVTDIFPPDIGGPATFIADLAAYLTNAGYSVTVFCTSATVNDPDDRERPYHVQRLLRRSGYIGALTILTSLILAVIRHDRIFCNGLEMHTYRACRLLNRPYVLKVVGDLAWENARTMGLTLLSIDDFQSAPGEPTLAKLINQRMTFSRYATTIITPSQYLSDLVAGWGCDPARIHVIYNGIDLELYASQTARQRRDSSLRLLYVGRLVPWKGIDHLLVALQGLDGIYLTLLGDGPERASLEAYAVQNHIPAEFKGNVTRSVVRDMMSESDVLVLVSSYEGLSHTLIEACASGLPSITSNRGGNPEVIEHHVQGLVVPYNDIDALRAAIITLRDNEEM